MSTGSVNIASALRLNRDALAKLMGADGLPESMTVIDVRDDDHIGGHIKGSTHVPSGQLDWRLPELVRTLQGKDMVVFHCALSQQRGPKAAMRYLQERERLLSIPPAKDNTDSVQKVYVLDGGFVQWQEKYGNNEALTEAYAEDLWSDY